ncbi:hypothetical protein GPECTOR_35g934 [Gonium pectorale]|uniref:phytol kinase n=1 Tax=Gonium pectorale TaxID=33097 RepID=A0A150GCB7_GONPE|nr:hypothetical protein GPECTOR_35g934 [Gonium pectorale]|eukprot:KXZ47496.1 hypothetical protein GPECTOR_35g934 [Gonium pectorale]
MSGYASLQLRGMVAIAGLVELPPPGRRATLELLRRVGWLAVASARQLTWVLTGEDWNGSGSGGGGAWSRVLPADEVFMVAIEALQYSWRALPERRGAPEADALRAAEEAGLWQLAAAIAADVMPYATAYFQVDMLSRNLALPQGRLLIRSVAAALDGGVLPCLERLMRRAGRNPQGREASLLLALGNLGGFWPYLAPLLAYGDPRQGAALLVTLGKLLRTVGPQAILASWGSGSLSDLGFLQAVFDILREAPLADAAAKGAVNGLTSASAGPSGSTAAAGGTPARLQLPWRPELLREAAAQLRSCEERDVAAEAERLAAYTMRRGAGGAYQTRLRERSPLASALPPPAEARRLLPAQCANPACANLEGDSEADLALKVCARCGSVGYCCRPCQTAHWRAGHKEACGSRRDRASEA